MSQKQKHYVVKWEIDIYADSPEEAVAQAIEIQHDHNSEALVFDVYETSTGSEFSIDGLQMKNDIIKQIQNIISAYEDFGTGDVDADFSPQLGYAGDVIELLEHFYHDSATAVTYDDNGNVEMSTRDVDYDCMPLEVLKEILTMAKNWEEIQIQDCED